METRVHARLTTREGRRFGFTLGGAFLVVAAIAWSRGSSGWAGVVAVVASLLVLAALVVPAHLGPVERGWLKFAHLLSLITTPLVMAALYFGVMMPLGLLRRSLASNPIEQQANGGSYWKTRPEGQRRSSNLHRQF